jgi:hypothetical protein
VVTLIELTAMQTWLLISFKHCPSSQPGGFIPFIIGIVWPFVIGIVWPFVIGIGWFIIGVGWFIIGWFVIGWFIVVIGSSIVVIGWFIVVVDSFIAISFEGDRITTTVTLLFYLITC